MQRILLVALVAGLVLAVGPRASAAGVPWKKGDDNGAAAAGDLKEQLGEAQYTRVVAPIEAKLKMVTKTMEAYEKEMQKPIDKRSERVLLGCKQRAATFYIGAAMAAKQAASRNRDQAVKAGIIEQFQKPNEQKAIDIYLELAMKAQDAGDIRTAVGFYKRILSVDRENSQAKDALTKIAKDMNEAARAGKASGNKGGGDDDGDKNKSWKRNNDYSGTGGKHYDSGRGSW